MEEFNPDDWVIFKTLDSAPTLDSSDYYIRDRSDRRKNGDPPEYYYVYIKGDEVEIVPSPFSAVGHPDEYMNKLTEWFRNWYKLNNIAE